MKDHVEVDHLTKYDVSRVNRDIDLEMWFKSIQTSLILRLHSASPTIKPYKLLRFLISFVTTVKFRHVPIN